MMVGCLYCRGYSCEVVIDVVQGSGVLNRLLCVQFNVYLAFFLYLCPRVKIQVGQPPVFFMMVDVFVDSFFIVVIFFVS